MIQRIQSVYLFLVTVIMILPLCVPIARMIVPDASTYEFYSYGVVQTGEQAEVQAYYWGLFCLNGIAIVMPFAAIFLYKRRLLQMRLSLIEIFLCLGITALMWYHINYFSKEMEIDVLYRFSFILPVVCSILSYLATRDIIKDINLLKSYDRIR